MSEWTMRITTGCGAHWDTIRGEESDLREQGIGFTTKIGQKSWVCVLSLNGTRVATCRLGTWINEAWVSAP